MKLQDREFYQITEHNDWESETWKFYLVQDGNEKFIERLKEAIAKFDEFGDVLEIADDLIPENEVNILVKHSDCGYMPDHNKVDKILSPDLIEMKDEENFFQCINKGGLFDRE